MFPLENEVLQSRKFCMQNLKYPQGYFEHAEQLSPMCGIINWYMNKTNKDDRFYVKYLCACLLHLMQYCLYHWPASGFCFFNRQLLSLPLSLSEEELLRMRQELHCCFSQVDSSLAWPKIRARTLLQAFEMEQRDAEMLKVDQNLAMTNKQVGMM